VSPNGPGTQGYNPYSYAAGNPATHTDPSGHAVGGATTSMGLILGVIDPGSLIHLIALSRYTAGHCRTRFSTPFKETDAILRRSTTNGT
jgi:hypothetical protein